jgi:hypothetical protein
MNTSGKLIVDNSNKIWLFSKNYIHYFSLSKLSNQLKQNVILFQRPWPTDVSENITQISNSIIIGTTDGYYILNLNELSFKNQNISIAGITTNKLSESPANRSIEEVLNTMKIILHYVYSSWI